MFEHVFERARYQINKTCLFLFFQANAVFGKFIENKRDYMNMTLYNNAEALQKSINLPAFKFCKIISSNLVGAFQQNCTVTLDRPYAVGFAILELSKCFMYDSWYNVFMKHWGEENIQLGFSDTDSFLMSIRTKNLSDDLYALRKHMDFANYPPEHRLYSERSKNALYHFKDELQGKNACIRFCGLKAKCYSMRLRSRKGDKSEKHTCKGLGRVAIKNRLTFNTYKSCLVKQKAVRESYHAIQAKDSTLKSVLRTKVAMSAFDDKRRILRCGIHSDAYGNVHTKRSERCSKCE